MIQIKFGTSGWRGILADDFTFANARLVCQGIADFLKEEGNSAQGVVVAYDTRFLSEAFAATAAEVHALIVVPPNRSSTGPEHHRMCNGIRRGVIPSPT